MWPVSSSVCVTYYELIVIDCSSSVSWSDINFALSHNSYFALPVSVGWCFDLLLPALEWRSSLDICICTYFMKYNWSLFFPHFFGLVIVQKLNGHHFCPTAVPQHSINYFSSATDSFKSSKRDLFLTISQGSLMKKWIGLIERNVDLYSKKNQTENYWLSSGTNKKYTIYILVLWNFFTFMYFVEYRHFFSLSNETIKWIYF